MHVQNEIMAGSSGLKLIQSCSGINVAFCSPTMNLSSNPYQFAALIQQLDEMAPFLGAELFDNWWACPLFFGCAVLIIHVSFFGGREVSVLVVANCQKPPQTPS